MCPVSQWYMYTNIHIQKSLEEYTKAVLPDLNKAWSQWKPGPGEQSKGT